MTLIQGVLLCVVLFLVYKLIMMKQHFSKSESKPVPRIPFLSIFSITGTLPLRTTVKKVSLASSSFILQIFSTLAHMFPDDKLVGFSLPFLHYVLLTKPEAVEMFLGGSMSLEKGKKYDILHSYIGSGLLTSAVAKWKSRRKLLAPAFHFEILKEFLPVFDEQSKILVQILKHRSHKEWINIIPPMTLCTLDIICETALGIHLGAQKNSTSEYVQATLSVSHVVMDRYSSPILLSNVVFSLSSVGRKFRKNIRYIHSFTEKIIKQKKEALRLKMSQDSTSDGSQQSKMKRKALMDLLLDIHMTEEDFSERDVRDEVTTFAQAGHDTTAMAMSWALYLIGLYSQVQSKIHQELDEIFGCDQERPITTDDLSHMCYLECVLKESLRLYPAAPLFSRHVNQDIVLCGYKIKKGTTIVICPFLMHRNSESFPDPEKFDPERFLPENCASRNSYAYIPFSAGPRNCIGQRFAMMEEKTVVANLLRNFHVKSLEHRDKIIPVPEIILRSANPLKLKFTLRHCP